MTQDSDRIAELRAVRDALLRQISVLDHIGETRIAAQLDACIQGLNDRIGEPLSPAEIDKMARNYFGN